MKLFPLLIALTAVLLIGASQAVGAFGTATPDEGGANDVPGQKDLNSHNIDDSGLPNSIAVQWNWDELSTSGANTLDGCALLDTDDADAFANFAVCATTKGGVSPTGTTTLYSCGNTRVDRCSSPISVLTPTNGTACSFARDDTDPFSGPGAKKTGAGYPNDTVATCTIQLADFGVNVDTLELINTCSYPSQQPNSDPSDCVLIPRDATLKIVKDAGSDTTTEFNFQARVNTTGSNTLVEETITGSGEASVPIIGGKPNSVEELALPAGWDFDSAICTGGTNNGTPDAQNEQKINGIVASAGTTVTCTFVNVKTPASLLISKTDGTNALGGAAFAIDEDGDPGTTDDQTAMSSVGTGLFCADGLVAGQQYWVVETQTPPGYDGGDPQQLTASDLGTCAERAADTPDGTFVNTLQPGNVAVHKEDDAGNAMDGVTFTLWSNVNNAPGTATQYSCVTGLPLDPNDGTGDCTIEGVPAGTYWIVESNVPSGYATADPQQVIVSGGGDTETGFTFVNERTHKVIVIVCHEGTNDLAPTDVTNGDGTETTIGSAPAGVDEAALCGIEDGAFGGKPHGDKALTVHVGSEETP